MEYLNIMKVSSHLRLNKAIKINYEELKKWATLINYDHNGKANSLKQSVSATRTLNKLQSYTRIKPYAVTSRKHGGNLNNRDLSITQKSNMSRNLVITNNTSNTCSEINDIKGIKAAKNIHHYRHYRGCSYRSIHDEFKHNEKTESFEKEGFTSAAENAMKLKYERMKKQKSIEAYKLKNRTNNCSTATLKIDEPTTFSHRAEQIIETCCSKGDESINIPNFLTGLRQKNKKRAESTQSIANEFRCKFVKLEHKPDLYKILRKKCEPPKIELTVLEKERVRNYLSQIKYGDKWTQRYLKMNDSNHEELM